MPDTLSGPATRYEWKSLRRQVTDEVLAHMTQRIVDRFCPQKVILFGSYANGTPHEFSDVDLFVVMDSTDRPAERMAKVYQAAETPFVPMDVLVYTPDEVKRRLELGDSFIREIHSKGRVLYDRGHTE